MKSIQTKIICLILIGILVPASIVMGISSAGFRKALEEECTTTMSLTAGQNAEKLNVVLERVEQSVEILAEFAVDNLDGIEHLAADEEYLEFYTKEVEALGRTMADETQGAVAVYIRFNYEYMLPKSGFLMLLNPETGVFDSLEPTDLSLYEKDDIEHVGWYYIPVEAQKAVWMQPYYNKNLDIYMISYVIPVYVDGTLLGVVGMDIDFDYVMDEINGIRTYDTGYAFLLSESCEIVYSKFFDSGVSIRECSGERKDNSVSYEPEEGQVYSYNHQERAYQVMFHKLSNGMHLAVTSPVEEVFYSASHLIWQTMLIVGVSILGMLIITLVVTRNIVSPLKKLNAAAKEIALGNLEIALECKTKDEVGTLTESIRATARQLRGHIEYINNLAYYDKLTGVKNNTAYLSEVIRIKEHMREGQSVPTVFVIDVNDLKKTNDTYGHERGNELIIATAKRIIRCFGTETVYRIGGDEFVTFVWDKSFDECLKMQAVFEKMENDTEGEIKVSAAIGFAMYRPEIDREYEDIFRNADARMYEKKKQMKARERKETTDA